MAADQGEMHGFEQKAAVILHANPDSSNLKMAADVIIYAKADSNSPQRFTYIIKVSLHANANSNRLKMVCVTR